GAARRRRPVRDQHRAAPARDRRECWERDPGEAEPDRDVDRDAGGDRTGAPGRVRLGDVASLGRDGGYVHRGPGGGDELRSDQGGRSVAGGSGREVQPAPADRGGTGERGDLSWPEGVPRVVTAC